MFSLYQSAMAARRALLNSVAMSSDAAIGDIGGKTNQRGDAPGNPAFADVQEAFG